MEELESTISPSEFQEWAIYEGVEPFGAVRDDWRTAYMLAVIANMMRGKNQSPYNPMDFAPESVHSWFRAITEAGEIRHDVGETRGAEVAVPKPQNVLIFEDMYRDHVNNSGT